MPSMLGLLLPVMQTSSGFDFSFRFGFGLSFRAAAIAQYAYDKVPDPGTSDLFGYAVALSGRRQHAGNGVPAMPHTM